MLEICLSIEINEFLQDFFSFFINKKKMNAEELRCYKYDKIEECLPFCEKNQIKFDILVFDLEKFGAAEIQFVETLQDRGFTGEIMFLVANHQFATKLLQVQITNYLTKRSQQQTEKISITSYKTVHSLSKEEIIYVESLNKKTIFHLINNQRLVTTYTLKELIQRQEFSGFYQIHKSYFINTDHIQSFNKKECVLSNQMNVPIGRKFNKSFELQMAAKGST
ncbi:MAG: LytR/AlgR family response regulator transcription factor [Culicoidibacterales bacterium]